MKRLNAETGDSISRAIGRYRWSMTWRFLIAFVPACVLAVVAARVSPNPDYSHLSSKDIVSVCLGYGGVLLEFAGLVWLVVASRWLALLQVVPRLAYVIALLERRSSAWATSSAFRNQLNLNIERVARRLANASRVVGMNDPVNAALAAQWSSPGVQGLRELKGWIARPSAFTYTDVLYRLSLTLTCCAQERWFDCPKPTVAQPESAEPGRSKAAIALGVLLLASGLGLGALIALSAVGRAASALGYVVVALIVLGAARLGASTSDTVAVMDAGKNLRT